MTPALELLDLRKSFGKTQIIRGISLAVAAGERHAVIGPNGAGKSTLFNLISGRFAPSAGRVLLNGRDITGRKPYEINRLGLSRSFQITNIFHRLTVFENLRCAVLWSLGYRYAFWRNLNRLADAEDRAEQVLARIGLRRRRKTLAGLLTYAEQRAPSCSTWPTASRWWCTARSSPAARRRRSAAMRGSRRPTWALQRRQSDAPGAQPAGLLRQEPRAARRRPGGGAG